MKKYLLVLLLAVVVDSLSGETVSYWRFEGAGVQTSGEANDWLDDYSGNGHNLNAHYAVQTVIPASESGSKFSNPVPLTSAINTNMANVLGNNFLSASDSDDWTQTKFTVELYFNASSIPSSSSSILVSHFDSGTDDRGWFLGINKSSKLLQFAFSKDGQTGSGHTEVIDSPWEIIAGKDYYAAIVIDLEDTSSDGITFYLQNLTDGGLLLSANAEHTLTSLNNSDAQLRIANQFSGDGNDFKGYVDEVRISNVLLDKKELLISPVQTGSIIVIN